MARPIQISKSFKSFNEEFGNDKNEETKYPYTLCGSRAVRQSRRAGGCSRSAAKALKALGHDVRVMMPCYKMIEDNSAYRMEECLTDFPVPVGHSGTETAFVKQTRITSLNSSESIPVYLVGNAPTNGKAGYFQDVTDSAAVYTYAPEPYAFFARAALEAVKRLRPAWKPDILHCNDWHTGLIPVYAKQFYAADAAFKNTRSIFTIHNLAYQGDFKQAHWAATGLPDSLHRMEGLEFHGGWSFMKGGLQFADAVNTVSENYACEIQTPEYGCGLDGLMRHLSRQGKLRGIVNGIDQEEFNPATDTRIAANFSASNPSGKAKCKAALQAELKLPKKADVAVIGLISRLADQKGFDIIAQCVEKALELPIQFVLLGKGDPRYADFFTELQAKYPEQVRACITFDVDLAQRIYAGSDLFLMPSRFEPCGLGQMIALRYGSLPIVRATGGLADTIVDFDPQNAPDGNGFVFEDYRADELLATIARAVSQWGHKPTRQTLIQNALATDFSWERSALRYQEMFRK